MQKWQQNSRSPAAAHSPGLGPTTVFDYRGGEIISPAEVESAAMRVPGIRAAAAFPVGHDKLQECVGLVVVPQPEAADPQRRPVLPEMIECLSELLHPSKWPFMLVYMDQLPKGPTGKVGELHRTHCHIAKSNQCHAYCPTAASTDRSTADSLRYRNLLDI